MIECYLIAVCRASAIDRDTNNFSLFHVVEAVQIPPSVLGQVVPLEVHFYLETAASDVGREIEVRIVWCAEGGVETPGELHIPIKFVHRRSRTRAMALKLPMAHGNYKLRLDWRVPGSGEWKRSATYAPFDVELAPEPTPSTPPVRT